MRITILTAGSRGDVQPYVGLGVGLQRAGHQVCMPAPEFYRKLITEAGLDFVPIPMSNGFNVQSPQEILCLPEVQAIMSKGRSFGMVALMRIIRRYMADLLANYMDTFWSCSEDADLLIASTTSFGGLDCAEKRGITCIYAPQQPLAPTRAFPAPLLSLFGVRLNSAFNRLTYHLLHLVMWGMIGAPVNNWRLQMGLSRHSSFSYWRQAQAQTTVCGYSPSVLPTPTDWPANHHVAGYWFLDEPLGWQPPAELVAFLESGPAPVCVGFGSMGDDEPARTTRVILEALDLSRQRGVLLSGYAGLGSLSLPDTVFHLAEIPHSWLFPRTAAVVHHGGMGTTAAALRAGVPTVIAPFGVDQPFWARRVEQLGVGARCASFSKVTAKALATALDKVTTDTALRQRAAVLGEKIRAEDGVGRAVAVIQDYLSH